MVMGGNTRKSGRSVRYVQSIRFLFRSRACSQLLIAERMDLIAGINRVGYRMHEVSMTPPESTP